jgi:hypothetical protein
VKRSRIVTALRRDARERGVELVFDSLCWIVWYRFAGRKVKADTYRCPHTARAAASKLNTLPALDAWVTRSTR